MGNQEDIVFYLLPDGTKVSNDPRFVSDEQRQAILEATPHTGVVPPSREDIITQSSPEVDSLQASQAAGVGGRSIPLTGRDVQLEQRLIADDRGLDPNTEVMDPPPDSNEAVLKAREEREKVRLETPAAGTDEGDADYNNWTVAELKRELARRRSAGEDIDVSGVTKKSELAAKLQKADDKEE